MKISIAISTFEAGGNGATMINFNLTKIMEQTWAFKEVVISDHSKDNKINNEIKKFPHLDIKYVRYKENYGSNSCNTNNAMNNCTGDLIKVLFMDDYLYDSQCLEKIVLSFDKNPNNNWLVNSYFHTRDRKQLYGLHHPKWNNKMLDGVNTIGCPSNLTIRSSVKERFDEKLIWLMDVEYYYRLKKKHGDPIYLHEPLNVQLIHNEQLTSQGANKLEGKEKNYLKTKYQIKIDPPAQCKARDAVPREKMMYKCVECNREQEKDKYSKKQLRKNELRCKSCVA
jgi:hypothetical protein